VLLLVAAAVYRSCLRGNEYSGHSARIDRDQPMRGEGEKIRTKGAGASYISHADA
jgi:hypothetical protein